MDIEDNAVTLAKMDFKQRLDALKVPYAFGTSPQTPQNFVVRMNQKDFNETLLLALPLEHSSIRIQTPWEWICSWSKEMNYRAMLKKTENGTYHFVISRKDALEASKKGLDELYQKAVDAGETELCLYVYGRKILCEDIKKACDDGDFVFSGTTLDDGAITEKNLPFFQLLLCTMNDTKQPCGYEQKVIEYVDDNGELALEASHERTTGEISEEQISQMSDDEQTFQKYFEDNRNCFSGVREKTRYYFCKYLYYYLTEKMEDFVSLAERRVPRGDDFDLLKGLKGITPLKRKQKSPEETRKCLEGCDVSCGEVFEEFNHFYFDYISNDWVEILSECLVDVSELTRHKQQLIEQREEQDEKKKNRLGETMIRRFIKGNLDIDRSTLISMLLFFSDAFKDETRGIDRQRLDLILDKCGFSMLRAKDDFDSFVIGYMEAEEREDYLMNEATQQALNGENFYLYHVYRGAESQAKLLRKYLK